MLPDPIKYLWDALHVAELVYEFAQGRSFADYKSVADERRDHCADPAGAANVVGVAFVAGVWFGGLSSSPRGAVQTAQL